MVAFRKVILPLAAPSLFTAAILTFFIIWIDFSLRHHPDVEQEVSARPAALAFFSGASQFAQPTAPIAGAAVVVTVPIIILVLVFQQASLPAYALLRQGQGNPPLLQVGCTTAPRQGSLERGELLG